MNTYDTRNAASAAYRSYLTRCAALAGVLATLADKAAKVPNEDQCKPDYAHGAAVTAAYAAKGQPVKGEDRATTTIRDALLLAATDAEAARQAWHALPVRERAAKDSSKGFSLDF